jgi:hypothetical protein
LVSAFHGEHTFTKQLTCFAASVSLTLLFKLSVTVAIQKSGEICTVIEFLLHFICFLDRFQSFLCVRSLDCFLLDQFGILTNDGLLFLDSELSPCLKACPSTTQLQPNEFALLNSFNL